MYGLTMLKDYLIEILEERKTYDARSYLTSKRGTIALIYSKTLKVYGYADLIAVREISPEEYAQWHSTGRWSNIIFQVDKNKKYYAWEFRNIRKEENPFKINASKKTWMIVDNK